MLQTLPHRAVIDIRGSWNARPLSLRLLKIQELVKVKDIAYLGRPWGLPMYVNVAGIAD